MNRNKQPSPNAGRTLAVSGLTIFVLGSMLWEIVSAYLTGGSDAPTTGILIAAIAVLGGGIVLAVFLILRQVKQFRSEADPESAEEA